MLPHALSKLSFVERFYSYPELASTSDTARSLNEFPGSGIFVIQADRQTAGRGRWGASFFSDSPRGLWVSIVTSLSPHDDHFAHNRALTLAICESIEDICRKSDACAIKWPNDIYWGDRKLCGILLENHPKRSDMLIIGFGINSSITAREFPPELQSVATSIFIETGQHVSRSTLLEAVLGRYRACIKNASSDIHHAYTRRLYGVGRFAEIDGKSGIFTGVEIDGRLRLDTGSGILHLLSGHLRFPTQGSNAHAAP